MKSGKEPINFPEAACDTLSKVESIYGQQGVLKEDYKKSMAKLYQQCLLVHTYYNFKGKLPVKGDSARLSKI